MPKNRKSTTIPRPLNCFLIYRLEKQQEIVAKCAGANHRDISKIIAKWWQEASEEGKRPFREKARLSKLEHQKLYPNYKYTPKKKTTPKRVYNRKNKKQEFTSRIEENNKVMKMIYEDSDALDHIPVKEKSPKVKPNPSMTINQDMSYFQGVNYYPPFENIKYYQSPQSQFVSPLTEASNETDITSAFSPSFEWDYSMASGMTSPSNVLDTPCIDTMNPCTVNTDYLINYTSYINEFTYANVSSFEYINPNILQM